MNPWTNGEASIHKSTVNSWPRCTMASPELNRSGFIACRNSPRCGENKEDLVGIPFSPLLWWRCGEEKWQWKAELIGAHQEGRGGGSGGGEFGRSLRGSWALL
jgi:hypothetical protein